MLSKKRKKERNDSEHNIFKRIDCHPTTLFDSNKNNEDKKEEEKKNEKVEKEKEQKKKKSNNNFCYTHKIKQLKDYMEENKCFIEEMMAKEKEKKNLNIASIEPKKNEKGNEIKKNEAEIESKEKNDKSNEKKDDIDMSLFWKLASINFENFNKIIKEQNKKNTLDPQVKIIGLNSYLNEYSKE